MLKDLLLQIGLPEVEARIYLELLRLGSQPASVIAGRLRINRSTIYKNFESLQKKGVISFCLRNGVTFFQANDPNAFVAFLDAKARSLDYYKLSVLSSLGLFRELSAQVKEISPQFNFCEGLDAVKTFFSSAASDFDNHLILLLDFENEEFLQFLQNNYCESLKSLEKDAKGYFFVSDFQLRKVLKNRFADFLSLQFFNWQICEEMPIFSDKYNMLIAGNNVAFFNLRRGEEQVILLKSSKVAEFLKFIALNLC